MLTERNLLVGIIDALGALTKRLTGETLEICVHDDDGNPFRFYFDGSNATIGTRGGTSQDPAAPLGTGPATSPDTPRPVDATPQVEPDPC